MEPKKLYTEDTCSEGHDLVGANGCVTQTVELSLGVYEVYKICRTCRGINNRSYGSDWKNARGQVFTFVPDHPNSRKDGFYPRSKLVMEEKEGRLLTKEERVLHWPEQSAGDDRPENLMLFPTQHALAQFLSKQYQEKKEKLGGGWAALTPAQRAYQESMARERLLEKENAARDAARERSNEALRKANEARKKK